MGRGLSSIGGRGLVLVDQHRPALHRLHCSLGLSQQARCALATRPRLLRDDLVDSANVGGRQGVSQKRKAKPLGVIATAFPQIARVELVGQLCLSRSKDKNLLPVLLLKHARGEGLKDIVRQVRRDGLFGIDGAKVALDAMEIVIEPL